MSFHQLNKHLNIEEVLSIENPYSFNAKAIQIFHFQYKNNEVYKSFVDILGIVPERVKDIAQIPFLPISFFKTHMVLCGNEYMGVFTSSATSGKGQSKHYVKELFVYEKSFIQCFNNVYGNHTDFAFLALLPSYMEREGSSLVYMADYFVKHSKYNQSGFYLNEYDNLIAKLLHLKENNIPTVLLGVSFALLEFAEKFTLDLSGIIVMETGGMKGKREELTRVELHNKLCKSFNVDKIHSEYGMTELMSQFYSKGDGVFSVHNFHKIFIRDLSDPFTFLSGNKTGGINIVDLTNMYSCSFIATDDVGRLLDENTFEVLGRTDNSEMRGCNLLV